VDDSSCSVWVLRSSEYMCGERGETLHLLLRACKMNDTSRAADVFVSTSYLDVQKITQRLVGTAPGFISSSIAPLDSYGKSSINVLSLYD
jgi:hypothetical protein